MKVLHLILKITVGVAIAARDAAAFLGAPLWRLLARLAVLRWLSAWIGSLPRWGVLVSLLVPLAVAEPLKIAGLWALATGHLGLGLTLQGLGHGLSLVLVERIIDAGSRQLMTYPWFAWCHARWQSLRAQMMAWPAVVTARLFVARTSLWLRLILRRARSRVRHEAR